MFRAVTVFFCPTCKKDKPSSFNLLKEPDQEEWNKLRILIDSRCIDCKTIKQKVLENLNSTSKNETFKYNNILKRT